MDFNMKLGLSLSGGGVKGAAHIGVIKALEEKNIKIDSIAGTSSGSIVATLYAMGYNADEIYKIFKKYCKKIKYVDMKNIIKLIYGLVIRRKIIIDGLNSGKVISFSSLKDKRILDNTEFVNNIDIGKAVRASCSYPVVFSPCTNEDHKLIDGGIRENTPWRELKEIGTEKVISIVFKEKFEAKDCFNIIDVASRAIGLLCNELSNYEWAGSDYLVEINTKKIGLLDMDKIDYLYELGYNETKKQIKKLKI